MNLYELNPIPKPSVNDEVTPEAVWEKYQHKPEELKKREHILAKDAKIAFQYAKEVLNAPFKAGEAAIADDRLIAHEYANFLQVLYLEDKLRSMRKTGQS